jgi:hypothetical protein
VLSGPDPTAWLLEESNPSVRYWALRDLVGLTQDNAEVLAAQAAVMASEPVRRILTAQKPGGWWEDERNMYLPKYTSTTHSLLLLAELGASLVPEIRRGVEYLLLSQRHSGHFLTDIPATEKGYSSSVRDGCCLDANILYYLIHFGYLDDPRTKKLLDFIVDYHSSDAGWKCRSYPINLNGVFPVNCYMGAVKMLRSLSTIPRERRSVNITSIIDREVESVLENGVYSYLRNSNGSRKDKSGWKKFGFPLFYQSDALELLDTLTRLGVHDDRMLDTVKLVSDTQRPDGRWLLENTYNGKMWVDFEEKKKSSKWITLRALRALRRFHRD